MARDESKKTTDTDQQQVEKEMARELTDQELAKVSGGSPQEDDDLKELQVQR